MHEPMLPSMGAVVPVGRYGAAICGLDLIFNGVSQCTFGKISSIAVFAGPMPETGTEAVSGCNAITRIALNFHATEEGR